MLCELEKKHSVKRWLPSDEEYKKCEHLLFLDKKE